MKRIVCVLMVLGVTGCETAAQHEAKLQQRAAEACDAASIPSADAKRVQCMGVALQYIRQQDEALAEQRRENALLALGIGLAGMSAAATQPVYVQPAPVYQAPAMVQCYRSGNFTNCASY